MKRKLGLILLIAIVTVSLLITACGVSPEEQQAQMEQLKTDAKAFIQTEVSDQVGKIPVKPGPLGPQGPQGIAGASGSTGTKGEQGAKGVDGVQGPQGIAGVAGARGQDGYSGGSGGQGPQGIAGLPGIPGLQGTPGTAGVDGLPGVDGLQGIPGEPGAIGTTGAIGDTGAQGIQGERGVSAPMLRLVQKDATTWGIIDSGTGGLLQYTPEGREFGYLFEGFGLTPNTSYSLIYYADFENRTVNWGGNNPGALIASGTSDSVGGLHLIGSVDLGFSLPSAPDANISTHDYSVTPDYYPNAHGAKVWLVPSSDYNTTDKKVTAWNPNLFLFETDLINYTRQ